MESEGIPLEEAPYGEYLKILRKEGFNEDADEFELTYTLIFHDLGYSKEDLFATSFNSVQEILEIYSNEIQRQLTLAMVKPPSFPVHGTAVAGEGIDEDTINRVAAIQMRMHEEKMGRERGI